VVPTWFQAGSVTSHLRSATPPRRSGCRLLGDGLIIKGAVRGSRAPCEARCQRPSRRRRSR
jgi:hypothetical protein